jgi:hypothetical protein
MQLLLTKLKMLLEAKWLSSRILLLQRNNELVLTEILRKNQKSLKFLQKKLKRIRRKFNHGN